MVFSLPWKEPCISTEGVKGVCPVAPPIYKQYLGFINQTLALQRELSIFIENFMETVVYPTWKGRMNGGMFNKI